MLMDVEAIEDREADDQDKFLLETLVGAHFLSLQLRMLAQCEKFAGREATEFLAAALADWARMAERNLAEESRETPPEELIYGAAY